VKARASAQLLRQDHQPGGREAHRHLLEAVHHARRGDHLRLQVPARGRQDPLQLRRARLPRQPQLNRCAFATLSRPLNNLLVLLYTCILFCTSVLFVLLCVCGGTPRPSQVSANKRFSPPNKRFGSGQSQSDVHSLDATFFHMQKIAEFRITEFAGFIIRSTSVIV